MPGGNLERLSVKISADIKSYQSDLQKASKITKGWSDDVDKTGQAAERSEKRATGAFGRISQKIKGLRSDSSKGADFKVRADEGMLTRIGNKIRGVRGDAARGADFEVRGNEAGLGGLMSRIKGLRGDAQRGATFNVQGNESGLSGLSSSIRGVRSEAGKGATMQVDTGSAESAVSGLKSSIKDVGAVAAGVVLGDAAGGGIEGLSQNFQDASRSAGMLQAQLGISKTQAQGFKQVGLDVYTSNWGDSLGEVTNAVGTTQQGLSHLGASKSDLKTLTQDTFILRDAFGIDLQESINSTRSITQNFGTSGKKAMDLIAYAAQNGANASGDLTDTFNEYSPYFKEMGFNAQQFTGILIGGMKGGARNTDLVADAMKEMSIRVLDGSKTTKDGFKAIGLNANQMSQEFGKGGESAQQAFKKTLTGLASIHDPVKREQAGVALFGTQWEDLGPKVVLSMAKGSEGVGKFEGSTKRAGDALSDNFGASVSSAIRKVQTFASNSGLGGAGEVLGGFAETAGFAGVAVMGLGPLATRAIGPLRGVAAAAWAASGPLLLLAGIGAIVIGVAMNFDQEAFEKAKGKAKEDGAWIGAQYGAGVKAGLKSVPIIGPFMSWLQANQPKATVWDVVSGDAKAKDNRLLGSLQTAYGVARGWLDAIQPKATVYDVISGNAKAKDNRLLGSLQTGWAAATGWLQGLQPNATLYDVLSGRKKASQNPITNTLQRAYSTGLEWIRGIQPEATLWDVLSGRKKASQNPITGLLSGAYNRGLEFLRGLQPEATVWDVLSGRKKAKQNPITGLISGAYNKGREFLNGVQPKATLWDVLSGKKKANANPITNALQKAKDKGLPIISEFKSGALTRFEEMKSGSRGKLQELAAGGVANFVDLRKRGLASIGSFVGGGLSKYQEMRKGGSSRFEALKGAITDRLGVAKTQGLARISELGSGAMSRWTNQWNNAKTRYSGIRDTIGDNLRQGKDRAVSQTREMGSNLLSRWSNQRDENRARFNEIRDNIGNKLRVAKERGTARVRELGGNLKDSFGNMLEGAKAFGSKWAGHVVDGIKAGVNKAREWMGGLMTAVGNVLEAIGADKLAGAAKERGEKLKAPLEMAKGGIVGMRDGGMASSPTVLYGEAGPEAYVRLDKRTPESQEAARAVMASPNAPKSKPSHERLPMALGGIVRMATGGFGPQAMVDAVTKKWPSVELVNRHAEYMDADKAARSMDFFVAPGGVAATGSQRTMGDQIAAFLSPPSTELAVWFDQMNYGSGWGPIQGAVGIGNENTLQHRDHVHATAHPGEGFEGGLGGASGTGGQSSFDWMGAITSGLSGIEKPSIGAGMLGEGFGGFGMDLKDMAKKYLVDKAKALWGSITGAIGKITGSQAEVAFQFAQAAESQGMPGRLPVMTALQESTMRNLNYGDGSSLGYFQQTDNGAWGTAADRMNPEKSLGMFLDAAQKYKGQYSNSPEGLGAWAQAVQASDHPGLYAQHWGAAGEMIERGRGLKEQVKSNKKGNEQLGSLGGYLHGGIIPGRKGEPKNLMAHAGEMVLPEGIAMPFSRFLQDFSGGGNDSLKRLANSVELWSTNAKSSGAGNAAKGELGVAGQQVDRLEAELRAIREKLDDVNLGQPTRQDIKEGQKNGTREVMNSKEGAAIVKNQNTKITKRTRISG